MVNKALYTEVETTTWETGGTTMVVTVMARWRDWLPQQRDTGYQDSWEWKEFTSIVTTTTMALHTLSPSIWPWCLKWMELSMIGPGLLQWQLMNGEYTSLLVPSKMPTYWRVTILKLSTDDCFCPVTFTFIYNAKRQLKLTNMWGLTKGISLGNSLGCWGRHVIGKSCDIIYKLIFNLSLCSCKVGKFLVIL